MHTQLTFSDITHQFGFPFVPPLPCEGFLEDFPIP